MLKLLTLMLFCLCGLQGGIAVQNDPEGRIVGCFSGLLIGCVCVGLSRRVHKFGKRQLASVFGDHDSYHELDAVIRGAAAGLYSVRRPQVKELPSLISFVLIGGAAGLTCGGYADVLNALGPQFVSECAIVGGSIGVVAFVFWSCDVTGDLAARSLKRSAWLLFSAAFGCLASWLAKSRTHHCLAFLDGLLLGLVFACVVFVVLMQPVSFRIHTFMIASSLLFGWVGWEVDGLLTLAICAPFGATFVFSAALPEWRGFQRGLYITFILAGFAAVLVVNVSLSSVHGPCRPVKDH